MTDLEIKTNSESLHEEFYVSEFYVPLGSYETYSRTYTQFLEERSFIQGQEIARLKEIFKDEPTIELDQEQTKIELENKSSEDK